MKNKLISISIVMILIFTSLICVDAIAPTPRIDLDDYQLSVTNIDSVYITGTISLSVGQTVGVYDSNGRVMYNYVQLNDSNKKESFKIQVPARYLSEGVNTFKIKSTPIRGEINGSK